MSKVKTNIYEKIKLPKILVLSCSFEFYALSFELDYYYFSMKCQALLITKGPRSI